ncbi:MAG: DNRLRE domain-containing protein [Acidobacteriota bacterium]|nr:MAG: DNRLRE domain-containing protein [Acidobacteriota bacterium]
MFAFLAAALAFAPALADVAVIQPSQQDSYVDRANTKVNYGTDPTMSVGRAGNNTQTRSLVQFDLSSIPAGATINSAQLELYAEAAGTDAAAVQELYDITEAWVETTVTWQGQPANSGTVRGSLAPGTSTGWKIWTVTASVVQGWLDTPATNYGLLVRLAAENANVGFWLYATRENATSANRPILRVDYTVLVCSMTGATATALGPTTFCDGGSVDIVAAPVGGTGPFTYLWAPNGETTTAITATTSGGYDCEVTDTGEPGCVETTNTVTVTVNPNPTATITPSGPTTFCEGGSVTLTASDTGAGTAPYTYLWAPGGETTTAITVTTAATYTVEITDDNGCVDTSAGETVTVNAKPATTIIETCGNPDSTLDANASGGTPPYTYSWSPDSETSTVITKPCETGPYDVTVTDSKGCSTTSDPVSTCACVVCGMTGATASAGGPTTFCEGGSVVLTASATGGTGPFTYLWAPNGETTTAITATTSGGYDCEVTDTGEPGCVETTNTITVVVNPNPSTTIVETCGDPDSTLDANASGGTPPYTYSWSPDSETSTIVTKPCGTGPYDVTVTDSKGCSTKSAPVNTCACSAPTVTVTPTNLAPGAVTQGQPGVAMERLAVATDFGTASWTKVKVDLYTTTTAADGDIAAVKVYDDAGATTVGSFDIGDGDTEIGSGTFSGGTVTITFGAAQNVTATTSYFYVVFDIACASTVDNNVGIQIVDETYFTMDQTVSSANMPFNSLDSLILASLMIVTPANLAPPSVTQGQTGVAMERMALVTNYCSVSWTAIRVDLYTTGVAFDTDVAANGVQIYDDTGGTPGSFDGTDVLIGQGTFSGGTVAITLAPAQVITTASQDFFIVYDIDPAAVVGHKVGIRIADETYFTTTGAVSNTFVPFNSTDSEIITSGGMVPDQVTDFDASDGESTQSTLTWTNPPDPALAEVVVRRKTTGFPVDNTDGTQAYLDSSPTPGAKVSTVDSPLVNGTTYYYAVFGKSSDNEWNDSVDAGKNADTAFPQDLAALVSSPTVLILSPVDGSAVGGTVTIKISAFDADNLAAVDPIVQVSFDGAAWSNAMLNANYPNDATKGIYEYVWDTTATVGADVEVAQPIFYRGYDTSGNPSPVRVATVTVRNSGGLPMGDGMLLRRANDAQLCMDCHALSTHSSEFIDTGYGAWAVNCRTCHTPHSTRNIYLVRETIKTPNSGYRDVLFKALTGTKGDNTSGVLADDTDTVQTNLCEVCHTKTKYHRNDAGHPNPGHKNAQDCTSCHPHGEGFKASGGDGGADCDSCHSDLTGALGDNTAKYHHYLQNFSMSTPYPAQAQFAPGDEEDTDRRCLMCHVDHEIFSPDPAKNPESPGRSYNLRTNVTVQPIKGEVWDKTKGYINTDFDNSLPALEGGICTSCHQYEQTKNTAKQKSDGTTKTPAINIASYDASAHDYATPTSTFTDSSTFNANCSRCHIDTKSPNKSSMDAQGGSTYKFGLHDSDLRRLVSNYGDGAATDPYEEGMCYNCHDDLGDGLDYYDVTAMSTGSQGIRAAFGSTYTHPVDLTSGVHLPYGEGESKGWNPDGSRHVECGDCHNPHVAQAGNHTPGAGGIGLCNLGARGVALDPATVASDSTFRSVTYTGYTDSPTEQYQICLLCHSEWGWDATPPNTISSYPEGSPKAQTDVGKDFDVDNYAFHPLFAVGLNQPPDTANANWDLGTAKSGDKWEPGDGTGTGLSNTFVDGWGQDSLVTCSDCHEYSDPAGPRGPHGSAYRWLLKGVDIYVTVTLDDTNGKGGTLVRYPNMNDYTGGVPSTSDADDELYTMENFCINCHRGDVYGWGANKGGGTHNALSRLEHQGGETSSSCMGTAGPTGSSSSGTLYPIGCLNCHGGLGAGEIHGSTRGVGSKGSNAMGVRFTNGSSWTGHDLGDDSPEEIGCYTPGSADSLTTCTAHETGRFAAPTYYYDYPGQ